MTRVSVCVCNCLLRGGHVRLYLHTEIGILHAFMLGKRQPCKSICSNSPPHYDNAHCVVIWQSEQTTSHKRACAWNASGSGGRGLNGNDLLWRKPKLFVSPHSREEEEVCLPVCLRQSHSRLAVCRPIILQMWEVWPWKCRSRPS